MTEKQIAPPPAVAYFFLVRPMLRALLIASLLATPIFAQRIESPHTRGIYHAAAYPTKPVVYRHKGSRYLYEIQDAGTKSERRTGRLFLDDHEITGSTGEILEEYLGKFVYFGMTGYNRGWLNTLTYDRPVFEHDMISVTPAAKSLLPPYTQ